MKFIYLYTLIHRTYFYLFGTQFLDLGHNSLCNLLSSSLAAQIAGQNSLLTDILNTFQ